MKPHPALAPLAVAVVLASACTSGAKPAVEPAGLTSPSGKPRPGAPMTAPPTWT